MTTNPSGRQAHLAAYGQELTVVEVGGGIRSYQLDGEDILDGFSQEEVCPAGSGQILAPWPNRLGEGRFEWNGTAYQTAITEVAKNNAIHGLVRWANWVLPEPETLHSPWTPGTPVEHLLVGHRLYPQPGWPWALELRVAYRLGENGLEVRTWATNLSEEPCPIGLGWHPYLRAPGDRVDDVTLKIHAHTAYVCDERGLPTGRSSVEGTALDFSEAKRIGTLVLDTAFTDLERDSAGRAIVEMASGHGRTIRLWMSHQYTHLMLFTGDTIHDQARRRRALAVEPMTAAPDMLRSGDGLKVLDPGETFEAAWGIQVL